MSITDELREYANGFKNSHDAWSGIGDKLTAIADRIDAEYQKAIRELNNLADASVLLPVDADGVPIRIGDTVKLGDGTFEVRRLELYDRDSWDVVDRFGEPFSPFYMRHVQPDTWERIIEDAAKLARGDNDAVMELVERCQRLAGEA